MSNLFDPSKLLEGLDEDTLPVQAPIQEPEAVEPEETPTEVEESEEEEVQQLAQPFKPTEVKIEAEDAFQVLYDKWNSKLNLSKDEFKEQFGEYINTLQEHLDAKRDLAVEKAKLEQHPAIQSQRHVDIVDQLWADNQADWEEELAEAIPDDYKAMSKLGKKQQKELTDFIFKEVGNFMINRVKSGKKVSNPLLAISPKITSKLKSFEEVKQVKAEAPPVTTPKPKSDPKKLAALSGSSAPEQSAPLNPGIAPVQQEAWNKLSALLRD